MTVTITSPPGTARLRGLDLARALALFGMVVVHFELVLGASGQGPDWLATLTGSLQGRSAATFVVLAGIGTSLGARRAARGREEDRRAARWALLRRAVALFLAGLAFLPIWQADILHFYGVWMAAGAILLFARTRWLVLSALGAQAAGAVFFLSGRYFQHWNLATLEYRDLGSPTGFLRNLLLDGWHPVFPWIGLFLYGMVLGRLDLRSRQLRLTLAGVALPLGLALHLLARSAPPLLHEIQPAHLLMTTAFPPTPAFLEFGACVATLVVVLCLELADRLPPAWIAPAAATGQLALSFYVGHVVLGLGTLEALGRLENQSLVFAVGSALAFCAFAMLSASIWLRFFRRGPLELLLRRLSGTAQSRPMG